MNSQEKLILGLTAVLTTAAELGAIEGTAPIPLGPIYMGLMERADFTFDDWTAVTTTLTRENLAQLTSETIELTPKGILLSARLEQALQRSTR